MTLTFKWSLSGIVVKTLSPRSRGPEFNSHQGQWSTKCIKYWFLPRKTLLSIAKTISCVISIKWQGQTANWAKKFEVPFCSKNKPFSQETYTLYEYFVCHASLSGPNDLWWWDFFYAHAFFQEQTCYMNEMTFLYDMTISFFYAHAFFPGINMLHEWNHFPIWHDYLFLLCTCFFPGINMPHEWYDFLYDMTRPLSIVCLFPKYKHATWIICLYFIWTSFSSICLGVWQKRMLNSIKKKNL